MADFNLAVVIIDRQTTKFNSPPNFPAIRYMHVIISWYYYGMEFETIYRWNKFMGELKFMPLETKTMVVSYIL